MLSAASSSLLEDLKSQTRAIGSGRLVSWRFLQCADIAARMTATSGFGAHLAIESLDPVIEQLAPDRLMMTFSPVARFCIDFADRSVSLIEAHPEADRETITHLVDDHVAPRIIAAGGHLVLHGSAVLIDGRIAVFLGQTGSGKSTLAASLHAAGHRLLGDDAVVISEDAGAFHGEAVYASLRLYRESIDEVFRERVDTSAMAFYSDKLHVAAANVGEGAAERYPLGAIFTLAEGDEGVMLDLYSPVEGCMALVENSFALDPEDPVAAAARMTQAARVAANIPCYELAYPYDFGLLGEARAQVIASLATPPESA